MQNFCEQTNFFGGNVKLCGKKKQRGMQSFMNKHKGEYKSSANKQNLTEYAFVGDCLSDAKVMGGDIIK